MTHSEYREKMGEIFKELGEVAAKLEETTNKLARAKEEALKVQDGFNDSKASYDFIKNSDPANLSTFKIIKTGLLDVTLKNNSCRMTVLMTEHTVSELTDRKEKLKERYSTLEKTLPESLKNVVELHGN
jgi:chromosome segregation ATPase